MSKQPTDSFDDIILYSDGSWLFRETFTRQQRDIPDGGTVVRSGSQQWEDIMCDPGDDGDYYILVDDDMSPDYDDSQR